MKQYLFLPFYVADVSGYVMTGPPLVYQFFSRTFRLPDDG